MPGESRISSDSGLIFNIQRFSIHDGPGIRTTVFMKGCPLKCKWCSNPESIATYPEIMTYDEKCLSCRKCLESCSVEAIFFSERGREIDRAKCNYCLQCAQVCPSGAIQRIGNYMTMDEVLKEVDSDLLFYQNSGGGMTVSGGEPLLQWEFVRELCRRCKEKGIPTALDTSGYVSWERMERVLEHVDLVLYDIKHTDTDKHKEGTGVDNELILKNAKKTAAKARTWLRVPLIPGYNDSDSDIRKLIEFALTIDIEKISILPYHEWGTPKYPRLATVYQMEGTPIPNEDCLNRVKDLVKVSGLPVTVGS